MNFFGIGTLELLVIFLVGLLILGPAGMIKVAQQVGAFIRSLRNSELWQAMQGSKSTLRRMEQQLMSETELDSLRKDLSSLDVSKLGQPAIPSNGVKAGAQPVETPPTAEGQK